MAKGLLHYIHHAAFRLTANDEVALFDPYLDGNPEGLDIISTPANWIFISHAHHDHVGDAFAIARRCNATIVSTAEVCHLAEDAGCKTHAMHIGGTHLFRFGKVRITPAFHGSGVPGGHACGFIVNFWGAKLYFAGDTSIFVDMAMLQRLDPFDIALLPIGGNFTMDPSDAAMAAEMIDAPMVVPMHYNTWPVIAQDPEKFKADVESRQTRSKVVILKPGEDLEI